VTTTITEPEIESPGIEGDYDDIVAWMNENPVKPVEYILMHGDNWIGNEYYHLNWGIFSINQDANKSTWVCDFKRQQVFVRGLGFTVEDPENSHTLRF
jgi:hypothetical protein